MQAEADEPIVRFAGAAIARGGRRVLTDVDLAVARGERLLVVGANGAGKSTLLRAIAGLDGIVPGAGERRYAIGSVATRSPLAVRRFIATVGPESQERFARLRLPLTVREIVGSGIDGTDYLHRTLAAEEMRCVDATMAACAIAEIADRSAIRLSQGQLRRALLARALVANPRLLVLDEALEGLDASAHAAFLATLARIDRSVTIVLSSHRVRDLAPAFDRIAVVERGTVRAAPASFETRASRTAASLAEGPVAACAVAPNARADALVSFANVDLAIDGQTIVRNLTWCIKRGEHWRVLGANGSGKSTLLRAVAGELAPAFGGRAAWFGRVRRPALAELRTRVALVSDLLQTRYDRDETVRDVAASGRFGSIGLYATPTPQGRRLVCDALGVCGLEASADEPFASLSYGLRRRVLLARALAVRPELLILDETLAGCDGATRERIFGVLERLAANGTTIVVAAHHDDDVPEFITRRLLVSGGSASIA